MHQESVWIALLMILVIFSRSAAAQAQRSELSTKVDAVFAALDKKDSPGCALAVVRHGKIVYERGYGMANLDYNLAISPKSNVYIASPSKQFTAFSVALLAERGKLSLDDPLTKYFPELPVSVYGSVTIRQLIHHTSGIRDYFTLLDIAGKSGDNRFTQEDFLDLLGRQRQLNFPPGDQFLYSNSGYALLAILVERVSGKSFRDFTAQNIFQPLGMEHTFFRDDPTVMVTNRATGYSFENGSYKFHAATFTLPGSGGLLTTVDDLFLWDQNFYHNKLSNGTSSLLTEIQTPGHLNSGKALPCAFGLEISEYRGLKMIKPAGASFGYRAQMLRFPAQEFSVICLCNSDAIQVSPDRFALQVADVYLASESKQAPTTGPSSTSVQETKRSSESAVSVPENELATRVGVFEDKDDDTIWKTFLKPGKLHASVARLSFELQPKTHTQFRATGDLPILIEFPGTELAPENVFVTVNGRVRALDRINTVSPSIRELSEYAGEYYSDELDVQYRFHMDGGDLKPKVRNRAPISLTPLTTDQFSAQGDRLSFERGPSGTISQFTLNAGRVMNIRFIKKGGWSGGHTAPRNYFTM